MRTRGMTLIEIMVVVAIIGMLMSMVGVHVFGQLKTANLKATRMMIENVQQAVGHYQTDHNFACPNSLDELRPYLTKDPLDAWGERMEMKCPGEHNPDGADLISKGPDRQAGTADDIKSWER